jgi:hypothetical protein
MVLPMLSTKAGPGNQIDRIHEDLPQRGLPDFSGYSTPMAVNASAFQREGLALDSGSYTG